MSNWTIFSNHGHVLVCLARDSEARLRDVAADVGLTERAVQKIVRDLQDGGMISVSKQGRRNTYRIDKKNTLRHNLEAHCTLGALLKLIVDESPAEAKQPVLKPKQENKKLAPLTSDLLRPDIKSQEKHTRNEVVPVESVVEKKKETPKATRSKSETPDTKSSTERQQGSLF